jgi:hypothetical protein
MESSLKGVATQSETTAGVVSSGFAKMDESIAATASGLTKLKAEMRGIASAGRSVGAAPSIRNGGHTSALHFSGSGVALPGDQHARISGGPAMAAAGAVGYGAYEEAKIQDYVNKIFLTGNEPGSVTSNPLYKTIRDSILKSYVMTGMPLDQIEEAFTEGTRILAPLALDKRIGIVAQNLPWAATEAYLKPGTSMPDAMKAFVGQAHMQGQYGAEQQLAMAKHMAYLSTTTDASLEQLNRAASYVVPILRTANFDPGQLLSMITALQRAGVMNTKSGTWIDNMFERSFPGTSLMSERLFLTHEKALRTLGLIDSKDHQTFLGDDGRPDAYRFMDILGSSVEKMDKTLLLATFKSLFGAQGEKAAAFFSDPVTRQQIKLAQANEPGFVGGEKMWSDTLANSPIVQFRTAFAGLNVELINLGSNVLPYVTGMLKEANTTLGGKGELGVLGAGALAWMFKGALVNGIKVGGSRLLGLAGPWGWAAAGAAAVAPSVYDAMLRDDIDHPGRRLYIDPGVMERARRSEIEFRADPEGARGRVMSSGAFARATMPPPIVNTKVNVYVDGKYIPSTSRVVNDASGFDGQSSPSYPDHGFH